MSEAAQTRTIMKALASAGAKAVKIHGNRYTESGTPDIVGCYAGRAFVIEVKTATGKVTAIQDQRRHEWVGAGAVAVVARPSFDVAVFLRRIVPLATI